MSMEILFPFQFPQHLSGHSVSGSKAGLGSPGRWQLFQSLSCRSVPYWKPHRFRSSPHAGSASGLFLQRSAPPLCGRNIFRLYGQSRAFFPSLLPPLRRPGDPCPPSGCLSEPVIRKQRYRLPLLPFPASGGICAAHAVKRNPLPPIQRHGCHAVLQFRGLRR